MDERPTPRCESCGILMLDAAEHGAGDPDNPRCRLCAHADGSPLGYEEAVASQAHYLQAKGGVPPDEAFEAARKVLEGNPAWRSA